MPKKAKHDKTKKCTISRVVSYLFNSFVFIVSGVEDTIFL